MVIIATEYSHLMTVAPTNRKLDRTVIAAEFGLAIPPGQIVDSHVTT